MAGGGTGTAAGVWWGSGGGGGGGGISSRCELLDPLEESCVWWVLELARACVRWVWVGAGVGVRARQTSPSVS